MNINYAQGIVILIVLACVLPANCAKNSLSKSNKQKENAPSKSNHENDKNVLDDKQKTDIETILLNIAIIIQRCIDNKTMNNKEFKIYLDKLYNKKSIKSKIKHILKQYMSKVNEIKKKYEEDVKLLKIINKKLTGSKSKKNKNNQSKKSENK